MPFRRARLHSGVPPHLAKIIALPWHLTLLAVQHRAVLLLLVTKLEMLRPLDRLHVLLLALRALELQSDLLRRLGLVESSNQICA